MPSPRAANATVKRQAQPRRGRGMRGAHLIPLFLLLIVASAPAALAHAELAGATPPPNGRATAGLSEVTVRFTEQIDPGATTVEVLEPESGAILNTGDPTFAADRYSATVTVEPLADGIYTVRWRALSTSDGHTTRGAYVFAVGGAALGPGAPQPQSFDESDYDATAIAREAVPRAVYFGGLFLALGMPLFALTVLRREPIGNAFALTAGVFAILGAAAGLLTVALLARRLDFAFLDAADTVAGTLFFRRALLLGLAGLALLASLALPLAKRRGIFGVAAAIALGALVTTSLGSHAAGVRENANLAIASDALHLLMASVWIGGIVAFLHVARGRDARSLAGMIHRFTPLAIGSVVVLLATGTYAGVLHIPQVSDLWQEPYGRFVAAKALLMLPLILLGAYNARFLAPRLADARASPSYFRRAVQLEAVLMVLVIGLAGALASSAPPREDGVTTDAPADAAPEPFMLDQNTRRSHVVLEILPDPPTVGPSNVTIIVHTAELPSGTQVYVTFESPDLQPGEEGRLVVLKRVGEQDWSAEDTFFTSPGTWQLHVTIQRGAGFESEKLTFEVPVEAPGATT